MLTTRRHFLSVTAVGAGVAALGPEAAYSLDVPSSSSAVDFTSDRALPRFAEPAHLDVAAIQTLTGDEQALLLTLQGLVNRQRPSIYFLPGSDPTDQTWLNDIDVPKAQLADPWELLAKHRRRLRGAIVYDSNAPDTINVATSLAGLEEAVIATPALARRFDLPVTQDLRRRFKDKFAAYEWLLSNYWPRLEHRIVAAIGPSNTVAVPGTQWKTLLQMSGHVHDASNKAEYTADLTPLLGQAAVYVRFQDAYSSEGWGPSVQQVTVVADGKTIASFQPGTAAETPFLYEPDSSQIASGGWRFADGSNYFIYAFKPPAGTKALGLQVEMWNQYLVTATNTAPIAHEANPNFRDYIVATRSLVFWLDPLVPDEATLFGEILQKVEPNGLYLGWFPNGNEAPGVTLCAQHSVAVGATDFFNNGTVFGGVRAEVSAVPAPPPPLPAIENKVYVTLTMSEGDNLQYDQHRMRMIWDDPGRGQTPLNWSVSPLLLDAAPLMLSYYQRTRSENDLLVAGPSGAGYTYPGEWPAADLPLFTERSGRYMRRTGLNGIYALNRNGNNDIPLSDAVAARYVADVNPPGILYNWESASVLSLPSGLPVFTQVGVGSIGDGQTALANALAGWDGKSPLFFALGILAWNLTPTDVNTLVKSLSSQYQVVRGDTFFQLIRQVHKL